MSLLSKVGWFSGKYVQRAIDSLEGAEESVLGACCDAAGGAANAVNEVLGKVSIRFNRDVVGLNALLSLAGIIGFGLGRITKKRRRV